MLYACGPCLKCGGNWWRRHTSVAGGERHVAFSCLYCGYELHHVTEPPRKEE